jgi:hypothetical protein
LREGVETWQKFAKKMRRQGILPEQPIPNMLPLVLDRDFVIHEMSLDQKSIDKVERLGGGKGKSVAQHVVLWDGRYEPVKDGHYGELDSEVVVVAEEAEAKEEQGVEVMEVDEEADLLLTQQYEVEEVVEEEEQEEQEEQAEEAEKEKEEE